MTTSEINDAWDGEKAILDGLLTRSPKSIFEAKERCRLISDSLSRLEVIADTHPSNLYTINTRPLGVSLW